MKFGKSIFACLVALAVQGPGSPAFATAPKESCRLQTTLQIEKSQIESADSPLFVEVTFRFRAETPYARVIEKKVLVFQPEQSLSLDSEISSVLYERSLKDVLVSVFPNENTRTGLPILVEQFLPEQIQADEAPNQGSALICTQWAS